MPLSLDTLPGLVLFSCVVRHGSLTGAAQELGLNRSSVSKQLARFETQLGAKLLQRTTRKLALTELGERVWQEAQTIATALENVDAITEDYRQNVRGRLKVSCSSSLARVHLVPLLPAFNQRYPEVDLLLQLEDRFVDLTTEQVDIAIRVGHLPDSSLVARKLGELQWQLVASPGYLAEHGAPQTPADLAGHACLFYQNGLRAMNLWTFTGPKGEEQVRVKGALAMNDACALVDAAINGLGILLIDRALLSLALASGQLLPLLPEYQLAAGLPVYAVYPAREWLPAKAAAFVEFILQEFAPRLAAPRE
ncbi:LysR family transcriptional regulator [Iodobacter fluviatilis]|uniref:D-malate degradation protein R n=1 Tax=Iodobacter fluviatilis TaxID=537 RepID=A0A377Q5P2_9NEIS|nr:LysR family transcriptional regulator [Iodobacter fluviatilis]TCU90134.1 LysR family transcriptional regulator [Iodobacter fluviatilis]STQ89161.1 D-malate degradation protein R [Iodobacter fluviatilis]